MKIVALLSIAITAAGGTPSPGNAPHDIMLGREDVLGPVEITAQSEAALHGSASAALRLSQHYLYFSNDLTESNFWLQVAAELGDCSAIWEYIDRIKHVRTIDISGHRERWERKLNSDCRSKGYSVKP